MAVLLGNVPPPLAQYGDVVVVGLSLTLTMCIGILLLTRPLLLVLSPLESGIGIETGLN